jgi:hypothetical protein
VSPRSNQTRAPAPLGIRPTMAPALLGDRGGGIGPTMAQALLGAVGGASSPHIETGPRVARLPATFTRQT